MSMAMALQCKLNGLVIATFLFIPYSSLISGDRPIVLYLKEMLMNGLVFIGGGTQRGYSKSSQPRTKVGHESSQNEVRWSVSNHFCFPKYSNCSTLRAEITFYSTRSAMLNTSKNMFLCKYMGQVRVIKFRTRTKIPSFGPSLKLDLVLVILLLPINK